MKILLLIRQTKIKSNQNKSSMSKRQESQHIASQETINHFLNKSNGFDWNINTTRTVRKYTHSTDPTYTLTTITTKPIIKF